MAKAVFCVAKTEEQIVRIVNQLREAGFSGDDVSVLLPDRAGSRDFAHEQHTEAPEGAAAGAVADGVMAGVLGWLPCELWNSQVRRPNSMKASSNAAIF
jgi:hypothetical protein